LPIVRGQETIVLRGKWNKIAPNNQREQRKDLQFGVRSLLEEGVS